MKQTPLPPDETMRLPPLRRLLQLLHVDRRRMAAGVALALLSSASGIALLAVSGHFITSMALVGAGGAAINYYTPAALIRLLAILRTGGRYAERLVSHDATLSILGRLRSWLFGRLIPLAPARLGGLRSAELYSRIRGDVDALEHAYLGVLVPLLVAIGISAGVLVVTLLYLPSLALVMALLMILGGIALPAWTLRKAAASGIAADHDTETLRWQMADGLRGRAELALFGAESAHAVRMDAAMHRRHQARSEVSRIRALGDAGIVLLIQLAIVAALALGLPALRAATLAPADLTMLTLLAMAAFDAIAPLPAAWAQLGAVRASAQRIFQLADMTPAIVEPDVTAPLPAGNDLDIHQLKLRHALDGPWVLQGIDLCLPHGRHLAIVGASGAGKSSLTAALARLQPYEGSITLGGVPLDAWRGDDVRARIAVVEQKPYLFDTSLRENLRLACPQATDARLHEVIGQARLGEFVGALPRGLDTWIGENGAGVSGGEARRIAIARALLLDAPILVLDEPTEGLDVHTAAALYRSLAVVMRGRTVILITHQLGALAALVDDVAIMDQGHIAECMPTSVYLARCQLARSQANAASIRRDQAAASITIQECGR
jgi:ATP-binding cassette subfamily C protein CydC